MIFLPKDEALADLAKQVVEDVVKQEGHCHVVGWRDVPVAHEVVGRMARDAEPRIVQVSGLTALVCTLAHRSCNTSMMLLSCPMKGECEMSSEFAVSCTALLGFMCFCMVYCRHASRCKVIYMTAKSCELACRCSWSPTLASKAMSWNASSSSCAS